MSNIELAKIKLDRAMKMAEKFEDLNEEDLRCLLLCLLRSIDVVPTQSYEKSYLYSRASYLQQKGFGQPGG